MGGRVARNGRKSALRAEHSEAVARSGSFFNSFENLARFPGQPSPEIDKRQSCRIPTIAWRKLPHSVKAKSRRMGKCHVVTAALQHDSAPAGRRTTAS